MLESERIADVLKDELSTGKWKVGAKLPSVDDLCARFGTGGFAVRRAVRKLRDEGLVVLKRHVGACVTAKASCAWKGRVAFVAVGTPGSYFIHKLSVGLAERFRQDGWDLTSIFLETPKDSASNVDLVARLAANDISFAIFYCSEWQFVEVFDHANVPYVVLNGFARDYPNARAVIREETRTCYGELIRSLRARHLNTVLEVDFERITDLSFKLQFFKAGINVQRLFCKWDYSNPLRLIDVKRCGHAAVADYFAGERHRKHPPDVILFDDDYLAEGGIVALLEAGLRIPEDIKVVSFSNRGNEPILGVSLARIENDPYTYGDAVAGYVLKLLSGRRASPPRIAYRFISGASLQGE